MKNHPLLSPKPLPFTFDDWIKEPFAKRITMLCVAWTTQGYGAPILIYAFYLFKILLYIAGWFFSCSFSNAFIGATQIIHWWFAPEALEKFLLWSILFEVLGLGCGSGPLTARYFPPFTAALHFARPGTIKMPLFPKIPFLGSDTRNWFDVLLYLALLFLLVKNLIAPQLTPEMLVPVIALVIILGVLDKTIFLAARSEHYLIALFCFLFVGDEIAGLKFVWLAIWWGAATSKLNKHFPTVVGVMLSNHAVLRWNWFKKKLYKNYPTDLRPGQLTNVLAHISTFVEYAFPLLLIFGDGGTLTTFALVNMFIFHLYITSSVPMGVPLEWNVIMVYGAFVLFGANANISMLSLHSPVLIAVLFFSLLIIPLLGNLFPQWISFLLSMRYYAGNWAYSIWLFKGDSEEKLNSSLIKSCPTVMHQLDKFYDEKTARLLFSKVIAFRAMHLHGRALQLLVPKAVNDIELYQWRDGELIGGIVLGWNFGDGHLHNEQLLNSIQKRCKFESGELRCIFVESQPIHQLHMDWRIVDAKDGEIEKGRISIKELIDLQPY
ncbi:MAG: DUF3556 domain-containing protein [Bacteroidetes bacterium]|nr:DUF3556 domain-containing protein [Bacteroidota bacterium]